MTNMKVLMLCAVLTVGYPMVLFAACGGVNEYYALLCRGPLDHRIVDETRRSEDGRYYVEHVGMEWQMSKNREAAGRIGRTLELGSCAWEDRPVFEVEPSYFRTGFGQIIPQYPPSARFFIHEELSRCNNNSQCVFVLCAKNRGPFFDINPGWLDIHYPFGPAGER